MPMAIAPAAVARRDAAPPPAAIQSTKLFPPTAPFGFVARPRLADRLTEALERGDILVTGPAGAGKTSMLADWARRRTGSFAWLGVDDLADERTFLELLDAAVEASAGGLLLVIDDYDRGASRSIQVRIVELLLEQPAALRVVLACRSEPDLPLARLRAAGGLTELGAADLVMRDDEVAAVSHAAGLDLSTEGLRLLQTRTEGWAAGVALGLSLLGAENAAALDFLLDDVLERQPAEMRAFLRATSIVERVSGELANALTVRRDGQALLERAARDNLFLRRLDDRGEWWRYHQLFAEFLRARLRSVQPEDVTSLHRTAAEWFAERGLTELAIEHALDAGVNGGANPAGESAAGPTLPRPTALPIPDTPESLSTREVEVLRLVAAGRANRQIADELFITIDTVKRHVTHILGKLGAKNRTEAAARARRYGFLGGLDLRRRVRC